MSDDVITVKFVKAWPIIYVNLFTPRSAKLKNGQTTAPKFGAMYMMDPESDDAKAVKDAGIQIMKDKFPGWDPRMLGKPWELGDKHNAARVKKGKKEFDNVKGKLLVQARSTNQPQLATLIDGKFITLEDPVAIKNAQPKFYSGVEALGYMTLAPYGTDLDDEGGGNRGVTAYLDIVVSTGKGDRVGGSRVDIREAFKGYVGQASSINPAASDDPYDDV